MSLLAWITISYGILTLLHWRAAGRFWSTPPETGWNWGWFCAWLLLATATALVWPVFIIGWILDNPAKAVRLLAGENKDAKIKRLEQENHKLEKLVSL